MSSEFSDWIGRSEELVDVIEPARSNALRAALGDPAPLQAGDAMPLLHHWLYFWNVVPPAGLGEDGHPAKGGFLPPVPLPRRMWAGGRVEFVKPIRLGERVNKVSKILDVQEKTGKTGRLVFVTVEHRLSGENGLAIVEEQDLVYREPAAPGSIMAPTGDGPAPEAPWCESINPDTVLLFRYSALTMNGHRIHYDLPYAMDEEAYHALVVHGPLQASLLIDLAARKLGKPIAKFSFRGQQPAFAGAPLHVCGEASEDGASVWTEQDGKKNMTASVTTT
ncbi:MAG: MaoC family dehydratase N-terminal domain-containing protein [Novosphingobium sp.]|nr:MaoC family dehydratase N-terminal domain-containing protein [Novosphingobium sp.]